MILSMESELTEGGGLAGSQPRTRGIGAGAGADAGTDETAAATTAPAPAPAATCGWFDGKGGCTPRPPFPREAATDEAAAVTAAEKPKEEIVPAAGRFGECC
jgi:hypothetical protein